MSWAKFLFSDISTTLRRSLGDFLLPGPPKAQVHRQKQKKVIQTNRSPGASCLPNKTGVSMPFNMESQPEALLVFLCDPH